MMRWRSHFAQNIRLSLPKSARIRILKVPFQIYCDTASLFWHYCPLRSGFFITYRFTSLYGYPTTWLHFSARHPTWSAGIALVKCRSTIFCEPASSEVFSENHNSKDNRFTEDSSWCRQTERFSRQNTTFNGRIIQYTFNGQKLFRPVPW